MDKIWLYIAAIALTIHGLIELAPMLLRGNRKSETAGGFPKFIFEPLQNNIKVTMLLGEVFGAMRIIAAVGIFLSLMWGWALGVIISVVTFVIMTFYLPFGLFDGILSGIALVSLLIGYFGNRPIP
jgi:hypothetical protein